jgi:hypothetical protein
MSMSGNTVSIVLGTASGTTNTQANTTLVWTPSTAAFDWSGNLNTATAATESGAADPDF